jgi:uncharacterized protein with HEPN domain
VNCRERQRLTDIQAAIDAIRSHLQRGGLSDGLIFDAVRIRLLEMGEAVKALPAELLDTQPSIPWRQIARMRDHLAHRYFDTAHAILQATVDDDLPDLERAIHALAQSLPEENPPAPLNAAAASSPTRLAFHRWILIGMGRCGSRRRNSWRKSRPLARIARRSWDGSVKLRAAANASEISSLRRTVAAPAGKRGQVSCAGQGTTSCWPGPRPGAMSSRGPLRTRRRSAANDRRARAGSKA